jgi:hypothetical protein
MLFDFLDNRLGGCIALFVLTTLSLWYIKPKIIFDENDNARYLHIGDFSVSAFGISIIMTAIIVYYIYALIRYN